MFSNLLLGFGLYSMSIFSVTVEINNQFISPRLSDLCLLAASRVADILQRQMLHFGDWF